jgi:hypothetical protein
MEDRIKFNVGGRIFETTRTTILQYPDTVLARIIGPLGKPEADGTYFIDRDGDAFVGILNYYRSRFLERPPLVGDKTWEAELDFYGLTPFAPSLDGISNPPIKVSQMSADLWATLPDNHIIKVIQRFIQDQLNDIIYQTTKPEIIAIPFTRRHTENLIIPTWQSRPFCNMTLEEQLEVYQQTLKLHFDVKKMEVKEFEPHHRLIGGDYRVDYAGHIFTIKSQDTLMLNSMEDFLDFNPNGEPPKKLHILARLLLVWL